MHCACHARAFERAQRSTDLHTPLPLAALCLQGQCNTCVAFAVLAAAQSAIACAVKRDATNRWAAMDPRPSLPLFSFSLVYTDPKQLQLPPY